jgi:hypothetical protein
MKSKATKLENKQRSPVIELLKQHQHPFPSSSGSSSYKIQVLFLPRCICWGKDKLENK